MKFICGFGNTCIGAFSFIVIQQNDHPDSPFKSTGSFSHSVLMEIERKEVNSKAM